MGLFDKLREAVNTVVDTVMDSTQSTSDPLADEVVKKYFEIIWSMRQSFLASEPEPVNDNIRAKRYVEYFLGEACDEEKLKTTLELCNRSLTDYSTDKTTQMLSDFRKELGRNKPTKYMCGRYEAYKLFCPEEIEDTMVEYNKVLEVIKDNVKHAHFAQGIKKINRDRALIHIAIDNSFHAGNTVTKQIVLDYFHDILVNIMHDTQFNKLFSRHDTLAQIVVRALHFENNSEKRENYNTVTDQEYKNFVVSIPYYNKAIEDHPFDKEEYIEKFAEAVKESGILYTAFSSYKEPNCFPMAYIDDYSLDAICNLIWKDVSNKREWINTEGEDVSMSKEPVDIFRILLTYFDNPSND